MRIGSRSTNAIVLGRVVVPLALLVAATTFSIACSVETTRYADPDSLAKKSIRDPKGGYVPPAPTSTARTCPPGTPPPDPSCAVTWTKDLFTAIVVPRCGGGGCHSPADNNAPTVFPNDAAATRLAFVAYVLPADASKTPPRYYVDPCSRDPNASSISCNLATQNTCGTPMPLTPPTLAPADLTKISTWLACGAPL